MAELPEEVSRRKVKRLKLETNMETASAGVMTSNGDSVRRRPGKR